MFYVTFRNYLLFNREYYRLNHFMIPTVSFKYRRFFLNVFIVSSYTHNNNNKLYTASEKNNNKMPATKEKKKSPMDHDSFSASLKICVPVIESNILGVAKIPNNFSEVQPHKKRKVVVKKCRICKTTSGVIVSNACVEHLEEMREKCIAKIYE